MRDALVQLRQLLRDRGPTPAAARQMLKVLLRSLQRPDGTRPVEGIRRDPRTDTSMGVPFGFVDAQAPPSGLRIAAACHIFHPDLAAEIRATLEHCPGRLDVVISTDTDEKKAKIAGAFAGWDKGTVDIRIVENRGRDIGPKLTAYADVHAEYDLVLYVHSKRSITRKADGSIWIDGADWRRHLLHNLAGSPEIAASIVEAFHRDPGLGLVMAQHWEPIRGFLDWRDEFFTARELAGRMGISLTPGHVLDFPSGAMFWARPAALRPILDLGLRIEDFPDESGQVGGTPAHAVERLFLFACEAAGYHWDKVCDVTWSAHPEAVISIKTPHDPDKYRSAHGFRLTAAATSPIQREK